jgi:hypothetical protein
MTLTCRKEQLATAARSYPDATAVMEAGTLCTNDSATLLSLLGPVRANLLRSWPAILGIRIYVSGKKGQGNAMDDSTDSLLARG